MTTMTEERLLSKKDLAVKMHCTTRTIDRLVSGGKIPHLRIPTGIGEKFRTMFDPRVIEEWLSSLAKPLTQNTEEN